MNEELFALLTLDAGEVSLASYIMEQRGVPLISVPVFPRRRISQNHIYVNKDSGIIRLFHDPRAECIKYFRKHKYYPIMHMLVVKEDIGNHPPKTAGMTGYFCTLRAGLAGIPSGAGVKATVWLVGWLTAS